jgi:hypothetical protein
MSETPVAFQMVEEVREEFGPSAVSTPTIEAVVHGLPRAVAFRHVPPGGSGMENPENAVEQAKMGEPGPALSTMMGGMGQERFQSPILLG